MSDFTSGFWNLYVIVLTVASFGFCIWVLLAMSRKRVATGAAQPRPGNAKGASSDTTGHVWDEDLTELNNPLPKWWSNLFWLTLFFSAIYLVLYPGLGSFPGVFNWTSTGTYAKERDEVDAATKPLFDRYVAMDAQQIASDPQALAIGERLFLNYCSACHGSSAQGGRGFPNLTDKDWLYGGDPATIETTITGGRMGVMPAFSSTLDADSVKNVAAYVRSLSKLPSDGLRAHVGKPIFMQNCAACHGADGKGNPAVGAPNLTDDVWLYGSSEATIIEGINRGRNATASSGALAMPSFKDTLGEGRIHLLAAYVWSLSNKPPSAR